MANNQNLCPLQLAVIHKQFQCIELLLKGKKVSDPNLCGDGESVIHTVARFGCIEAFPILIGSIFFCIFFSS